MKRLILLVMMLLLLPGCVSALISSTGYSRVDEIAAEGLSRTDIQEKFGSPASSETTSVGRPVEIRYMRRGSGVTPQGLFSPGIVAECLKSNYICFAVEWVDIAIAPFALVAHEFNKFKIAFVYGPDNKVLYLYDQNADARERYRQATMTTAGIERCAAPARECVERYVAEARNRAIEVNYQIDRETEQRFQFEIKTAQNWDDGKITEEEVNKRLALRQFYLSMVSLTDPLLEGIRDGKCNVVETCVGDYIQQIRWKKVVAYDFTEEDEKAFNLELETARDADAGKITREQASDHLREISTNHLKKLDDLVED